jgi:hypothetical protein
MFAERLLIGSALLLASASVAAAQWNIEQLMAMLAQRGEANARFTEVKHLRLLSQPLTLSGTLTYRPPDTFIKHTVRPNPEIMTIAGDRISIEIPLRRIKREFALQDHGVLWGFVESIRATLRGDLRTLSRFYQTKLTGERTAWKLLLTPRDAKMLKVVRSIDIAGKDSRLISIDTLEAGGDRSIMSIREDER